MVYEGRDYVMNRDFQIKIQHVIVNVLNNVLYARLERRPDLEGKPEWCGRDSSVKAPRCAQCPHWSWDVEACMVGTCVYPVEYVSLTVVLDSPRATTNPG